MERKSLQMLLAIAFLLVPLPVVDLVGSPQNGNHLVRKETTGEVVAYGGKSIDNQTTDRITGMTSSKSISENWNILSPTLRGITDPASASFIATRENFQSFSSAGQYHDMFQSSSSSSASLPEEKGYYNFPLSSSSSSSPSFLPQSSLRTITEHHAHVASPLAALTSTSSIGTGTNQLVSSAEEIPMPLASSSRVTGPYFESNKTTIHISAKAGQNVVLECSVILLQGRTVSWLRRGKDSLQLLTVGNITYYSDSRLGLRFRYPNNWRLGIDAVNKGDEGEYQCQLSSHPPKVLIYHLKVIAPTVIILDENGHTVTERHYKVDSSLHLTCRASHVDKFVEKVVWLKSNCELPGGDSRIKVKLSKNEENGETTTFLSVLSVRKGDSGNYTCRASSLATSTVTVHVLNGELPAAVQHENRAHKGATSSLQLAVLILLTMSGTSFLMDILFQTTSCAIYYSLV